MVEYKQSRLASFVEGLFAASFAAPTAILLNDYLIQIFNNNLSDPHVKNTYLVVGWISFYFHSIIWKYVLRRLFTKYGFKTEPRYIYKLIKSRINHTAQPTS